MFNFYLKARKFGTKSGPKRNFSRTLKVSMCEKHFGKRAWLEIRVNRSFWRVWTFQLVG